AGAGDGEDATVARVDATDAVVAAIGDVDVTGRVDRQRRRVVQLATYRAAAVVRVAGRAVAGDRRHYAGGADPADRVVAAVGDVEVPRTVEREPCGLVELRRGRRAVVTGVARGTRARDHGGRRSHAFDDAVSRGVGEVDRTGRVDRDAFGAD